MDLDFRSSCSSKRLWCIGIFLVLLLLLQPALAAGQEPPSAISAQTASFADPLLADGWSWRGLFNPVQAALGNRRRMIQFATIGMCIGLYILMRK